MDLETYQKMSRQTALYPDVGNNFIYPTLGLTGEAGEVAEKIKKVLRDHGGIISPAKKEEIEKELGDVLWYVAQISSELGLSLNTVAEKNIEKLFSRKARNVLAGSGDNR
jgi:NTP pyrophosphatase (non-canonical NTP hydrolase)